MSQKKCPHCGEYVQSNSLTCPRCFREVPREPPARREEHADRGKGTSKDVPTAALLLAVIPPFVGLLGLGLICLHPKDREGYWFLAGGLMLFLPFLALFFLMRDSGFFSAVLMFVALVIILLIYISAAAAAFIETVFGSVLRYLRF